MKSPKLSQENISRGSDTTLISAKKWGDIWLKHIPKFVQSQVGKTHEIVGSVANIYKKTIYGVEEEVDGTDLCLYCFKNWQR